jgi:hypothetical protein
MAASHHRHHVSLVGSTVTVQFFLALWRDEIHSQKLVIFAAMLRGGLPVANNTIAIVFPTEFVHVNMTT